MGQYIEIGVCTEIRVAKSNLDRYKLGLVELEEAIQKEVGLHLFDGEETATEHVWHLKEHLLTQGFAAFLRSQRLMAKGRIEPEAEVFFSSLEGCKTRAEVEALTESTGSWVLQRVRATDDLRVGAGQVRVPVKFSVLVYLLEGKVIIDAYRSLFRYLRNALALQKAEHPIVEAVWATVE